MQDIEVVSAVLALMKAVCACLHTGQGVADGARVISAIAGTGVEEMDKRMDKMCVVLRVPGA